MNQPVDLFKVEEFWEWFAKEQAWILILLEEDGHPDRERFVQAMNNWVLSFGRFKWEIGTGETKPYHLTLSPNGDQELLGRSRYIMAYAPDLPNWEFYHAIPPKEFEFEFSLYDENFEKHLIDADDWQAGLFLYPDLKVKIILQAENILHLDHQTQEAAANYVLMNLIGEETMIAQVETVEIVAKLDEKEEAVSIWDLKL